MNFFKKALSLSALLTMTVFCSSKVHLEVYTVVKGDTLRSIAGNFYSDSNQWKEIHRYNDFIKDPHWIFPGDELVIPVEVSDGKQEINLPAETVASSTAEAFAPVDAPEEINAVSIEPKDADVFIADKKWKYDGYIVCEKEKKIIISQGDIVLLSIKEGVEVKPQDRMTIYHKERNVIDPYTGDELGDIIKRVGVVEIKNVLQGKPLTGVIIMAVEPLSVGDLIKILKQ